MANIQPENLQNAQDSVFGKKLQEATGQAKDHGEHRQYLVLFWPAVLTPRLG